MSEKDLIRIIRLVSKVLKGAVMVIILLLSAMFYIASDHFLDPVEKLSVQEPEPAPEVIDGIHVETGLIDAAGLTLVVQNCTGCHSSKLIIQNKMNLAGWTSTIKWMQETQNLWDLGANEQPILEYLANNYAPKKKGRRANLNAIEWYELE